MVASTVADLAQVLKGAAPYRDHGVDPAGTRERAAVLGAAEIIALVDWPSRAGFTKTDLLSIWFTNDTVL